MPYVTPSRLTLFLILELLQNTANVVIKEASRTKTFSRTTTVIEYCSQTSCVPHATCLLHFTPLHISCESRVHFVTQQPIHLITGSTWPPNHISQHVTTLTSTSFCFIKPTFMSFFLLPRGVQKSLYYDSDTRHFLVHMDGLLDRRYSPRRYTSSGIDWIRHTDFSMFALFLQDLQVSYRTSLHWVNSGRCASAVDSKSFKRPACKIVSLIFRSTLCLLSMKWNVYTAQSTCSCNCICTKTDLV